MATAQFGKFRVMNTARKRASAVREAMDDYTNQRVEKMMGRRWFPYRSRQSAIEALECDMEYCWRMGSLRDVEYNAQRISNLAMCADGQWVTLTGSDALAIGITP